MAEKDVNINIGVKGAEAAERSIDRVSRAAGKANTQQNSFLGVKSAGYYRTKEIADNRSYIEQAVRDEKATRIKAMRAESMRANVKEQVELMLFGAPAASVAPVAAESGKQMSGAVSRGFFADLNSQFGKRSALGKTLKLIQGAGVIGGISMAASEFNALTEKAESLYLSLRKGGDAWKETTADLLRSVPIVGNLGSGFARIWEMASGTTAYVADMAERTKDMDDATAAIVDRIKSIKDIKQKTEDTIAGYNEAAGGLGLKGRDKQRYDTDLEGTKRSRGIRDTYEEDMKAVAEGEKKIADKKKELQGISKYDETVYAGTDLQGGEVQRTLNEAYATKEAAIETMEKSIAAKKLAIYEATNQKLGASENLRIREQRQLNVEANEEWEKYRTELTERVAKDRSEAEKKQYEVDKAEREKQDIFGVVGGMRTEYERLQAMQGGMGGQLATSFAGVSSHFLTGGGAAASSGIAAENASRAKQSLEISKRMQDLSEEANRLLAKIAQKFPDTTTEQMAIWN